MSELLFEEMNLMPEILKAVLDMGFEEATPIQAQSIEVIRSGKDVIGQSQTGTGKTAAYAIPCIEKIDAGDKRLQAVILCPTRELAIQVAEEFKKMLKYKNDIRVTSIYGGQSMYLQVMEIKKGVQVIIGTPGRVIDHINKGTLKMDNVRTIILDEADEMLDMGFRDDIVEIMTGMPEDRQTILFSATMAKGILDLTKKFQKDPCHIKVARTELTVPKIEQLYIELKEKTKIEALCRILEMRTPKLSIVFCNTKKKVDEVSEQLQVRGFAAEALHGDLKQEQRDKVMQKFRNGTTEILVATDVAARGIDVYDIDIIFNYDLPQDSEYYVHRIGRTGRAGKSGISYTFIVGREISKLRDIMKYTKANIQQQLPPSLEDIKSAKSKAFIGKIKKAISKGHYVKYIDLVEELMEDGISAVDIAAVLMRMNLHTDSVKNVDFTLTENDRWEAAGGSRNNKNKDRKDHFVEGKRKKYNDADMVRLFLNVGKNNNIKVNEIVGCLATETGLAGKVFGAIDIYNEFTFVDVPKEYVKDVINGMAHKKMKGVKVSIEKAKKGKIKDKK